MASLDADTIPAIDISPFISPKSSQQSLQGVVDAVRHTCTTYGFFQLVGHGVSREAQESILDCAKRFFELPMEDRMEVQIENSLGKSFRGYEPPGTQRHQKGLKADTKEGSNLWPKPLPKEDFQIPVMEHQGKMVALVKVLLKILALGLPSAWGCSTNVFDEFAVKATMPMRLLHYAPQASKDESQFGVGDHTDFGGVTVLLQQPGTEGLEVWYPPTESWIPVPVKEDTFVINMGDMMQKWTAGCYHSARHRVTSSVGDKPRYSVPFFLIGNLKLTVKSLDGSGVETVVGEHIRQRLIDTKGESGQVLK